ncbi:MAG: serine hydrolase [Woeseia sp.]
MIRSTCLVVVLLSMATAALAEDAHQEILASKFQQKIERIADDLPGVLGVAVVDIDGDRVFGVNESEIFPQGSAIKISILTAMYVRQERGEMDLSRSVPIRKADRVGGSGYLTHFSDGDSALSLHDLAILMITVSDNMATNILIEQTGMDNVNAVMADLGFGDIRLQRRMIRQEQSARGNENIATPMSAAKLMQRILRCDLPISDKACAEMQDIVAIRHAGPIQDGTPDGIRVLQKTGSIAGVATSWGVVDLEGRPYALAMMGNYGDTAEINDSIRQIAELSHWYFSRLAGATDYGTRVPVELLERVRN